ncbi:MAG: sodium:solute symporter family protein [Planctomycetota bacterium]|nr:sodium:solute symporter family protein [Planctomycetota bacterium]MDA1211404.1 sodium:solute symporter family protein [Planctomycetota bacterium]
MNALFLMLAQVDNAAESIHLSQGGKIALSIALGLYLCGLIGLSIFATKKVETEEDYLVAGRRLPLFLAWGTLLATWYGAASMMGASQAAREEGILGVILDPLACAVTLVLSGLFFAVPLWEMRLLTIADFYRIKYGIKAEITSCLIQVPSYFGWIAAQYIALAAVLEAYYNIPLKYGIMIASSITLFYTLIGGMWSVTLTDTAQIAVALIGLVILAYSTFSQLGNTVVGTPSFAAGWERFMIYARDEKPDFFRLWPTAGAGTAVWLAWMGAWSTGMFGNLPGQDLNQRVFASRDTWTAKWACIIAGVIYLIFGMIPVTLGLVSNITHPDEINGKILPVMAGAFLSPAMAVVFVVSFVSIVVSTATSAVLAPATILGHNLLGRFKIFQGHHLLLDRACVVLVTIGGLVLAYSGESIMGLLDISLSIALVALFIPLAMGIYGKPRGEMSAVLAMWFGFVVWVIRYAIEGVVFVIPEDSPLEYQDWLASSWNAGSFMYHSVRWFGMIPADLQGLAASLVGYYIGQWVCRKHPLSM